MDEEEFDSLIQAESFTTRDATLLDAKLRRRTMLGLALWGRTLDELKRQLVAPHPEIPVGVDVAELRELHQYLQNIPDTLSKRLSGWLFSLLFPLAHNASARGKHVVRWFAAPWNI